MSSSDSGNRTARVLIVDDEKNMRKTLSDILTDEGYEMTTAATGEEAIEACSRQDFDVILTLESPFTYDPAQGSLLIDVRIFGVSGDLGGFFDTQVTTGDSVSRSWIQNYNGGGGSRDTTALVTQFTFTPGIPAPAAWAAAPLLGVLALRRRRH